MFNYFVEKSFIVRLCNRGLDDHGLAALAQSSEARAVAEDTWSGLSL